MNQSIARLAYPLWGIIVGLSLGLESCGYQKNSVAEETKSPGLPVKLEQVKSTLLEDTSEYVGVLEANQIVILKPEIAGRINQILVKEGDLVSKATPIMSLRAEKSQASLQSAIANLSAAQAAQNNAQALLSAVEAERLEGLAELELRRGDIKRISSLVTQGALPRRDLEQSERDLQVAQARLNTIEQRIKAQQASLEQAKANLKQVQANVNLATENLEDTLISTPITGIVGDIEVKIGDYVEEGNKLTTITDNKTLKLNFFVPIEQAPKLSLGLPIKLIDYRTRQPFAQGRVSFISPEVDFNSQTILAKASFANRDGKLFTGQLVKALLIWEQRQGISIPVTAVSRIGGETFVFVAETQENSERLIAKQKSVKLGKIDDNNYQVLSGLQAGETLITSGILNLRNETAIIPQTPE